MADNDSFYLCPKANGNWCYLPDQPLAPASLRSRLIEKIMTMKKTDIDCAREAALEYARLLPHLDILGGVREAMK